MLAIIQARSSSKRFKNKVMFEIRKKPLIWYVYNSVKKSKYVKKIIISTSKDNSDNLLVNFLKNNKINYFRGSLVNVAERLYKTAKKNKSDYFLRISGDSPLINSKVIIAKVISTTILNDMVLYLLVDLSIFLQGLQFDKV